MIYADVIVPLPLAGKYTYAIPPQYADKVTEGSRVIVQFGKKKYYTAIVYSTYHSVEQKENIKEIESLLDDEPIVIPQQLELWNWISSYYMSTLGEVYNAALPSSLKLESQTLIFLSGESSFDVSLNENEQKIFNTLSVQKPLSINDIEKKTKVKSPISLIKSLIDKGLVYTNETVKTKYKEKVECYVNLANSFSEDEINDVIKNLHRAKKQQELFIFFINRDEAEELISESKFSITKKSLIDDFNFNSSIIDSLVEKNILNYNYVTVDRFENNYKIESLGKTLNIYQEEAYHSIITQFKDKAVTLLHGVTSSGKTEIYIKLIEETINKGEQVLYLLPEIALTTQITERLRYVFGNKLLVYHSKFNDNERAETWKNLIRENDYKVVLGARSAVFLPFKKLGLVIIDEEHESSYKQQDPAPRYNAKNTAIVLASMYNAKTLLGTATPSMESYYNALSGRYGLVTLKKRHEDVALPEILTINTKELRKRKQMKTILSPPLTTHMLQALEKGEQIILFQNRRGFSSMIECTTCSWTPKCNHCDVSLTYHKSQNVMTCHYCGALYSVPTECPECNTPTLKNQGYGTERIEEVVSDILPTANIARMDLDTTRSKRAYERIITDFETNRTNVLIGTQMVSKGLDFENVSIVGILNADNMLNYPDFRAHEKAFQLMTQVSGRAGRRKEKKGTVYLQTAHPGHPIIQFIKENDYTSFYNMQIEERELFKYPPFYRLIEIVIRGKDDRLTDDAAYNFATSLRSSFNDRVLGPTKPPVSRIQSLYIRKIILKIENHASPQKIREFIEIHQQLVLQNDKYKSILIHYDVDPM